VTEKFFREQAHFISLGRLLLQRRSIYDQMYYISEIFNPYNGTCAGLNLQFSSSNRLESASNVVTDNADMPSWDHMIRFLATDDNAYFASLESVEHATQIEGQSVPGYATFNDLLEGATAVPITVKQVCHTFGLMC